jgi:hypothetical protein
VPNQVQQVTQGFDRTVHARRHTVLDAATGERGCLRLKLDGFEPVIRELEVELDYLRRATRYLED